MFSLAECICSFLASETMYAGIPCTPTNMSLDPVYTDPPGSAAVSGGSASEEALGLKRRRKLRALILEPLPEEPEDERFAYLSWAITTAIPAVTLTGVE